MAGGHGAPYTEAEDFLILDTPHLTCAEVGRMLGRTSKSVEKRRGQLRGREGITSYHIPGLAKGRQHAQPWKIGARTLIAKTCIRCGEMRNASHYGKYSSGRWHADCRICRLARTANWETMDPVAKRDRVRLLQGITVERATRNGFDYTEKELDVLRDSTKSVFQMALETGRTLHAVENTRKRYGLAPAVTENPADESRWIIRLPDAA